VTVRWDDLPADLRRRLGGRAKAQAKARPTPERAPRPSRTGDPGWTYRCRACGATTTDWAKAERHVNTEHGGGTTELHWPGRPGG
jgi:hypothetical protein